MNQRDELLQENGKLKKQLERMKGMVDDDVETLTERIEMLEERNETLLGKLKTAGEELKQRKVQNGKLEKELASKNERLQELEKKIRETEFEQLKLPGRKNVSVSTDWLLKGCILLTCVV